MERYRNLSGNSPITHFQIEDDRILYGSGEILNHTYIQNIKQVDFT